ncbi:hypothetical protein Q8A67_006350 [Cirrhinus molitorella]|uniref:Uncharacterized protein n=1 Tax=Cirrhinus molitorella TaxID=172907 RepID=A0AA88Q609_9TELE|nr:hypothetical protein Q8A67_006350 [Cirrhinus molitorella]
MAFIKEESADIRIEEVFSLKDTEEQTGLLILKAENQEPNEVETDQDAPRSCIYFDSAQEKDRTHRKAPAEGTEVHMLIKMAFIKEESEDIRIEEVFSLKDTEEQTGLLILKEENQEPNEVETDQSRNLCSQSVPELDCRPIEVDSCIM